MVPAVVVMGTPAFAVTLVPDALNCRHGFGLTPVHLFNQCRIHLLAKPYPVRLNLQCLIEKIILAGDYIDKIADAARRVVCPVYMDMDSAACVCKTSRPAKPPLTPWCFYRRNIYLASTCVQSGYCSHSFRYCQNNYRTSFLTPVLWHKKSPEGLMRFKCHFFTISLYMGYLCFTSHKNLMHN